MRHVIVAAALALLLPAWLHGQWLRIPTAGIPRTPEGTPNLSAPAPRAPDGRPSIAGLWRPTSRVIGDITVGMKRGETIPFKPWVEALFKERVANDAKDDPTSNCIVGGVPRSDLVPYPFKILDTPGIVVILYEAIHSYRQIFTDRRSLPKDPNPAWFGYSVGRWDHDAFVVESAGFNDNVWLDNAGRPATGQLRVTERFVRRDFGHIDIAITIDDPKAYTRPWTVTQGNNRYLTISPDAAPPRRPPARQRR